MKTITPVIKRTRVSTERYEVCPHCKSEIQEKSLYIDPENYLYHRACVEKGPIGHIAQMSDAKFDAIMKGTLQTVKKSASDATEHRFGTIEKNLSGVDYSIEWTAEINGLDVVADVSRPMEMPDHIWVQVRDAIKEEAKAEAQRMMAATDMARSAVGTEDGSSGNWLERAASKINKIAQSDFFPISIPFSNHRDIKLFTDIINQGIDSHLEAFTRTRVNPTAGAAGESRMVFEFYRSELPILVRRLREYAERHMTNWGEEDNIDSENAERWADDISEQDDYYELPPGSEYVPAELMDLPDTEWVAITVQNGKIKATIKYEDEKPKPAGEWNASDWRKGWHNGVKRLLNLSLDKDEAFNKWVADTFGISKDSPQYNPPVRTPVKVPSLDATDGEMDALLMEDDDDILASSKGMVVTAWSKCGMPDMMPSDFRSFIVDFLGYKAPSGSEGDHWKYTKPNRPSATIAYSNNSKIDINKSGILRMLYQIGWTRSMFIEWWKNRRQWLKLAKTTGQDAAEKQFKAHYKNSGGSLEDGEEGGNPVEPEMDIHKINVLMNKFPHLRNQFEPVRPQVEPGDFYGMVFDKIKSHPQLWSIYNSTGGQVDAFAAAKPTLVRLADGKWGLRGSQDAISKVITAFKSAAKTPNRKCKYCEQSFPMSEFACPNCGTEVGDDAVVYPALFNRLRSFENWVSGDEDDPDEMDDIRSQLYQSAAKRTDKGAPAQPNKQVGKPIDEALLSDGLGAFLDAFVNYHSGKEGDKLAKWIMAICQDPRFSEIAVKLEQLHRLITEVYTGVLEIAKHDNQTKRRVASSKSVEKKAMRPSTWNTGNTSKKWQDFDFDGYSLSWKDKKGNPRDTSFDELKEWIKENKKDRRDHYTLPTGEEIELFVDAKGIPEEPIESLVFLRYDYLGMIFSFETQKQGHRIKFFHNGQGKIIY